MQVARVDVPSKRVRAFIACYGSDAPDEVVRPLTQVEHRSVPPESSTVCPELPQPPIV
jgi:hypothetical protein